MKVCAMFKTGLIGMLFSAGALSAAITSADAAVTATSLTGAWTLLAADVQHGDGTRTPDYGAAPRGLLVIDAQGHYSLQIFKSERPRFASGDKQSGTPAEYKAAVMGSSTHFGTISVDSTGGTLTFHIEHASFPNWEGEEQKRNFELKDDELSYRVVPRPNGDVPISVWQRLK
ncbi:lipocalin-like domain protein [Caballeronia mineralivorans PML1(12)]|uniref:Lipocalin-like domain protein n=2 Tax=Caballeronia mineralivorans TaxID=2010198 RepID=A0A0J1G2J2_9BURK|nr:lipocalin-like domain protein [Caballeronia mineralivorans PML1(12)]